jgi:hypothetical protein
LTLHVRQYFFVWKAVILTACLVSARKIFCQTSPDILFHRAKADLESYDLLSLVFNAIMPSSKTDQKRKRSSDNERPSKKPALHQLPPLAASVVEDKSELAPVIGELKAFYADWELSLIEFLRYSRHTRSPELKIPPLEPIYQKPRQCLQICGSDSEPGHCLFRDAAPVLGPRQDGFCRP